MATNFQTIIGRRRRWLKLRAEKKYRAKTDYLARSKLQEILKRIPVEKTVSFQNLLTKHPLHL
jgi:chromatin segregation and condensation protein Rec8/ScpA/Scc1 (kleisin family)